MSVSTFFADAGDCLIQHAEATWATAHDDTSAGAPDSSDLVAGGYKNGSNYSIVRGFTPFTTSAIPDTDTITAAVASLYVTLVDDNDNDADDWVNVVQATVANPAAPAAADYDQIGAVSNPTEGSTRKDLSAVSTGAYSDWTLNATGLTWISKTGVTQLGWREGHDAINSAYTSGDGLNTRLRASVSETAGTTQDPKLVVTHGAAASNHFLSLMGVGT